MEFEQLVELIYNAGIVGYEDLEGVKLTRLW